MFAEATRMGNDHICLFKARWDAKPSLINRKQLTREMVLHVVEARPDGSNDVLDQLAAEPSLDTKPDKAEDKSVGNYEPSTSHSPPRSIADGERDMPTTTEFW